jgi:hypothetical protein
MKQLLAKRDTNILKY